MNWKRCVSSTRRVSIVQSLILEACWRPEPGTEAASLKGGPKLDFTPGEKAVLGQISVLYREAARRDQLLRALTVQWPAAHYGVYQNSYAGLVAKGLVQNGNNQTFRLTDMGLKVLGISLTPVSPPEAPRRVHPRPVQKARPQPTRKIPGSMMSRLVNGLFGRR